MKNFSGLRSSIVLFTFTGYVEQCRVQTKCGKSEQERGEGECRNDSVATIGSVATVNAELTVKIRSMGLRENVVEGF